jgi:hypothetical protein
VAQIALRSVDCILATYEQCSVEGFPWLSFDSIVPYTPLPTDFAFPTLANGCQVVSFHVEWEREPHEAHRARLQTASPAPSRTTTRVGAEAPLAVSGQSPLAQQTPLTRQLITGFRTPLCAGIPFPANMSRVPAHSAEKKSSWTEGGSDGAAQDDTAVARARGAYQLCPDIMQMECPLQYSMHLPRLRWIPVSCSMSRSTANTALSSVHMAGTDVARMVAHGEGMGLLQVREASLDQRYAPHCLMC